MPANFALCMRMSVIQTKILEENKGKGKLKKVMRKQTANHYLKNEAIENIHKKRKPNRK